jgi:hypothetical protein
VVELRHLDDVVSSTELLPAILKELDDAETLVRSASYTEAVGRRLLTVVGELSQLAGWGASDANWHRYAQRLYLSGVSAAEEAEIAFSGRSFCPVSAIRCPMWATLSTRCCWLELP